MSLSFKRESRQHPHLEVCGVSVGQLLGLEMCYRKEGSSGRQFGGFLKIIKHRRTPATQQFRSSVRAQGKCERVSHTVPTAAPCAAAERGDPPRWPSADGRWTEVVLPRSAHAGGHHSCWHTLQHDKPQRHRAEREAAVRPQRARLRPCEITGVRNAEGQSPGRRPPGAGRRDADRVGGCVTLWTC